MADPRKRQGTTPGHTTDIRIGVCRGLGLSREDTAQACSVSVPTVDLRKSEETAKAWEEWASGLLTVPSMSAARHLEAQARKRVGKTLLVLDRALDDDNIDTAIKGADRVLDRAFGKATQKIESTSDITERHVLEIPEETLARLREFAAEIQPRRIAAEVIDVQVEREAVVEEEANRAKEEIDVEGSTTDAPGA